MDRLTHLVLVLVRLTDIMMKRRSGHSSGPNGVGHLLLVVNLGGGFLFKALVLVNLLLKLGRARHGDPLQDLPLRRRLLDTDSKSLDCTGGGRQ